MVWADAREGLLSDTCSKIVGLPAIARLERFGGWAVVATLETFGGLPGIVGLYMSVGWTVAAMQQGWTVETFSCQLGENLIQ